MVLPVSNDLFGFRLSLSCFDLTKKSARENHISKGEKEHKYLEQAKKDFCSLFYNYFS